MNPSASHALEKEEDGDIAHTKAASGKKEATATVADRSAVQAAA